MPLPRKLLNDDEELLVELRPHWLFIVGPLLATAGVAAVVFALLLGFSNFTTKETYIILALILIPGVWLLGRVIRWRTFILALTTTRIVLRHGVFDRDTVQLRLQRITEINLSQKLWERALGTGRLVIEVQGEDDPLIVEDVRKPAIVQRVINAQINALVGGGSAESIPSELRPKDYRPPPRSSTAGPRAGPTHPPAPVSDDTPPFGVPAVQDDDDQDHHDEQAPDVSSSPSVTTDLPRTGATHADIRDRLIELDDLRQRGIISDEEFATKKADLLNRI